jgi:hypothetical protein
MVTVMPMHGANPRDAAMNAAMQSNSNLLKLSKIGGRRSRRHTKNKMKKKVNYKVKRSIKQSIKQSIKRQRRSRKRRGGTTGTLAVPAVPFAELNNNPNMPISQQNTFSVLANTTTQAKYDGTAVLKH